MSIMKNTILYSLFIINSMVFSVDYQQDKNVAGQEEIVLIVDNSLDEIYPLEDIDTACLVPEGELLVEQNDEIFIMNKSQLEELLDEESMIIQDFLAQNANIMDSDSRTISIDCLEVIPCCDNGIVLDGQKVSCNNEIVVLEDDEDDIVPVPHDLINSVKKANKQKRKLEKLERKEKANAYKKIKKNK